MKDFIKKNKFKILIMINLLFLGAIGVSAAIIFSSTEVSYDNVTSGMSSNNVQDAIDELYGVARLSDRIDELEERLDQKIDDYWETVYPVGSIYISTNSANPSTKFGGTWTAYGSGRTLVGVNTSDASFDTVEETGGGKTTSYTPAGSVGNTTLNTNQIPSHTHSIPALSGTAASNGAHQHYIDPSNNNAHTFTMANKNNTVSNKWANVEDSGFNVAKSFAAFRDWSKGRTNLVKSAGAHTHSVTTNASTTGASGGGGAHNHGFTGTAANISTVQPYITVYMWKRTA